VPQANLRRDLAVVAYCHYKGVGMRLIKLLERKGCTQRGGPNVYLRKPPGDTSRGFCLSTFADTAESDRDVHVVPLYLASMITPKCCGVANATARGTAPRNFARYKCAGRSEQIGSNSAVTLALRSGFSRKEAGRQPKPTPKEKPQRRRVVDGLPAYNSLCRFRLGSLPVKPSTWLLGNRP
jgi:hypothetical protein